MAAAESKVELRLNLTIFILLLMPVVSLSSLAVQWFVGKPTSPWIVVRSIVGAVLAMAAALPVAARLRAAPPIAALFCSLLTVAIYQLTKMQYRIEDLETSASVEAWSREAAFGHASLYFWIGLCCCGLAWHSRGGLVRPWARREFPRWALQGLKALARSDRWVALRLLVGVFLVIGALVLGMALGMDFSLSGRRALAKGCAALIALGMGSLFSCFRIGLDAPRHAP